MYHYRKSLTPWRNYNKRTDNPYSVHELCDALGVARGTFYNHIFYRADRSKYSMTVNNASVQKKIRIVLADSGIYVSKKRILAIMQKMGLSSVRVDAKNQFKRKQQYEKQNLLKREFSAGHPNQIWVSDITYLKSKATGSISASSWIYTYAKSSGGGYPET